MTDPSIKLRAGTGTMRGSPAGRRRPGFTLADLLVVVVIIAGVIFLLSLIIPLEGYPLSDSYRAVCMSNLKTIGWAFIEYAEPNDGKFARAHSEGDPLAAPTADNNLESISTNAMNQIWALIDGGYLPVMAFKCPADERWTPRTAAVKYGWTKASEFSYGIQYPFDHDPAGKAANPASPASGAYESEWILMADRNPGKRVAGNKDWPNHPEGCAYLKRNGNLVFHEDSNSVIYGQEIYGDDNPADGDIFPDSAGDVVILPSAPAD